MCAQFIDNCNMGMNLWRKLLTHIYDVAGGSEFGTSSNITVECNVLANNNCPDFLQHRNSNIVDG